MGKWAWYEWEIRVHADQQESYQPRSRLERRAGRSRRTVWGSILQTWTAFWMTTQEQVFIQIPALRDLSPSSEWCSMHCIFFAFPVFLHRRWEFRLPLKFFLDLKSISYECALKRTMWKFLLVTLPVSIWVWETGLEGFSRGGYTRQETEWL